MKIPVFISGPTILNKKQETARSIIIQELDQVGMEPRALGRTDYPSELPLREVLVIAKHCSGAVILGFEQFHAIDGIWKRGTGKRWERKITKPLSFPTPWNHVEAGILYALGLPLIIFREEGLTGGIFDKGVTDAFTNKMPMGKLKSSSKKALHEVILNWQRRVRAHYYDD